MNNFCGSATNVIHFLHPLQRGISFHLFRYIFLFGKRFYKGLEHTLCLLIHFCQMPVQRSGSQQIVIPNPVVLLQISPVSLSPNSDFSISFGRCPQIEQFIITLLGICAVYFFINAFQRKNLLCLWYFHSTEDFQEKPMCRLLF